MEDDESDSAALEREVEHRLGVGIQPGRLLSFVSHPYERYAVELYLYEGQLVGGQPSSVTVNDFRWVESKDFEAYEFTPADQASMSKLLGV